MKKILVTGGTGLIGYAIKNICDEYNNYEFIFVGSKEYNLIDYNQTYNLFEKYKPDYVIHLASNVGGLYKNLHYKVKMFEDNLSMNFNVVKCSYLFKITKLIVCLSTCVFPDKIKYPIDETKLNDGPPHNSNEGYAYAKRIIDLHCRLYREQFGCNFISVIPTNVFGENDNYNLEDSHVIPALIHKCYNAKIHNTKFVMNGSGKPLRQFIYSKDIARLIMLILEKYNENDPIILSTPEEDEISIGNIGLKIAKEFGIADEMIEFDETKSDGQYKKTASNDKLKKLFPEFKFTDMNIALKDSIKWFVDNYETLRK